MPPKKISTKKSLQKAAKQTKQAVKQTQKQSKQIGRTANAIKKAVKNVSKVFSKVKEVAKNKQGKAKGNNKRVSTSKVVEKTQVRKQKVFKLRKIPAFKNKTLPQIVQIVGMNPEVIDSLKEPGDSFLLRYYGNSETKAVKNANDLIEKLQGRDSGVGGQTFEQAEETISHIEILTLPEVNVKKQAQKIEDIRVINKRIAKENRKKATQFVRSTERGGRAKSFVKLLGETADLLAKEKKKSEKVDVLSKLLKAEKSQRQKITKALEKQKKLRLKEKKESEARFRKLERMIAKLSKSGGKKIAAKAKAKSNGVRKAVAAKSKVTKPSKSKDNKSIKKVTQRTRRR